MSACILYNGKPRPDGYIQIRRDGKFKYVHVLAWIDANGPIPDGMEVCHSCDVRNCINLDHLFLGTHQANIDDKVLKGRQSKSESHGMAKLTWNKVLSIREQYAKGMITLIQLARLNGVGKSTIFRVVHRKNWKIK